MTNENQTLAQSVDKLEKNIDRLESTINQSDNKVDVSLTISRFADEKIKKAIDDLEGGRFSTGLIALYRKRQLCNIILNRPVQTCCEYLQAFDLI